MRAAKGQTMTFLSICLALLTGALISVYLPMISQSAKLLNSVWLANVPFFGIAFVASVFIAVLSGSKTADFAKISTLPLWLLSAGIMSAAMVLGSSYLVPRIGISAFFVLVVSGQILAGIVFSQFGLFNAPVSHLSLSKIAGSILAILGAYLVTYK
ncbi:DMT family transporter [Litoreibacter albidus]|uniref:DMT family transporter n=1 Tax=Litoreibacter albidus TaxID=670155 RepID=UPI003736BB68